MANLDFLGMGGVDQGADPMMSMQAPPQNLPAALVAKGKQALASGQVSATQAKKNLSDIGVTDDVLAKLINPGGAAQSSPYVFGAPLSPALSSSMLPNPGNAQGGKKGSIIKSELTSKQDVGSKTTSNKYLNAQQVGDITQAAQSIPGMSGQQEGLDKLQDMIDASKKYAGEANQMDLSPLASLTDAWSKTPSHMAQNYKAPESPVESQNRLISMQEGLQAKRQALTKDNLDALAKLKSGTDQQTFQNQLLQTMAANQNNAQGNGTLGSARTNKLISDAGASFDKDPILKQVTTTNNSLDRATSIMNGKTPVTGKNFALLQQDMINAMAPGGAATEGKVNREMVQTLAAELNDVQARFGTIKDLRVEQPQVFKQLQSLINQVKQDYNQAGLSRTAELEANFKYVPEPMIQDTVKNKVAMLNKRFSPTETTTPSAIRPAALNKKPSEWTADDQKAVDAYEHQLAGVK